MKGIEMHIPFGRDNALTARELALFTGQTEREVRELIAKARNKVVILNMQDGNGYFRPTPEESELVERWVRQEEARLKSIGWSLKAARKAIREAGV